MTIGQQYISSDGGALQPINVVIGADQADVLLTTEATNNGWDGQSAVELFLWLKNGFDIYATSISTAALREGSFPSGSQFRFLNEGTVLGKGGDGGDGGANSNGTPGEAGGDAMDVASAWTITNGSGEIWAGGGGGGGGAGNTTFPVNNGSGGGGGAGSNVGLKGVNGGSGTDGNNGARTTGGLGGATGQAGGNGGGTAVTGTAGANGIGRTGGAGGTAGKAIELNGTGAVTWLSGSGSPNVKGTVS